MTFLWMKKAIKMTFAGMRNGEIVSQIESTKTPNDIRLARS